MLTSIATVLQGKRPVHGSSRTEIDTRKWEAAECDITNVRIVLFFLVTAKWIPLVGGSCSSRWRRLYLVVFLSPGTTCHILDVSRNKRKCKDAIAFNLIAICIYWNCREKWDKRRKEFEYAAVVLIIVHYYSPAGSCNCVRLARISYFTRRKKFSFH